MITAETLSRLELDKLLREISTHAHSDVTRQRIMSITPYGDPSFLQLVRGQTEELRSLGRQGIRLAVSPFTEIRPLLDTLKPAGAFLSSIELLEFIPLLRIFDDVSRQLAPRSDIPLLKQIEPFIRPFPEILEPLEASLDQDGSILDSASSALKEIRRAKRTLAARIRKKIEEIIRDSGIEIFLQDDFITQRSGRWVIPVRMDSKGMVKGVVHDVSGSGETAFVEPLEIIPFVNELENLAAEEKSEEIRILRQLSGWIREDAESISSCFAALVHLDMLNSCALFAAEFNLENVPLGIEGGELCLRGARHPLLLLQQRNHALGRLEPLNLVLAPTERIMVITGPNAGGKTIALKTAGLLALMGLCGLPVPASAQGSSVPLFDTVLVDIGDEQSIEQSHSTFSAHVARIVAILREAGPGSLVLLDELGAGTEPLQGAALACGVLRMLAHKGASVIATTHLTDIIGFVHRTPGMSNAGMEFDERTFTPLYRLVAGEPGQSHAIEIAQRFGMPEEVIGYAREILGADVSEFASLLSELRQKHTELESSRCELDERHNQLIKREQVLAARATEFELALKESAEKARSDAKELISTTRRRMNELLEELKREKKQEIVESLHLLEQELIATLPPEKGTSAPKPVVQLVAGLKVHVISLGHDGTIIQVNERNHKAKVRVGQMELDVACADLAQPVGKGVSGHRKTPKITVASAPADRTEQREINLIGMRVDEALAELEPFLNHALSACIGEARIIHGVGTGRLRDGIREYLSHHPLVEQFRCGTSLEGRDGATIVTLRT